MDAWALAIATLVGAALGGIGYKLGEEYFPVWKVAIGAQVRGEKSLNELFEAPTAFPSDICLFTATARRFLPLTDILYFEFLRSLLKSGTSKELLLGRWHPLPGYGSATGDDDWEEYDRYVNALFREFGERVTLVYGREILDRHEGELPALFWNSLKYIGADKHLEWAPSIGLSERRYRRLAQTKAGDKLSGTVAHTMNNTELVPHLASALSRIADSSASRPVVGVLFWELELDRLVVFQALNRESGAGSVDCPPFDLTPIAGRTVRGRFGRVSNNHSAEKSISLVASNGELIHALAHHDWKEVRQYRALVAACLRENYGFDVPRADWHRNGAGIARAWRITGGQGNDPKLSKSRLQLLFLISRLREGHEALVRSHQLAEHERSAPVDAPQMEIAS